MKFIKEADRLNIQLIFVPANDTGIYQHIYRKVFDIVKSKLRKFADQIFIQEKKDLE